MVIHRSHTAYSLVADSLRRRILSGDLKRGEQLPTERQLCASFGSSRITIRRALQILDEEMLVQRRQGSGTFVGPSSSRRIPILNIGFFNSVTRHAPEMRRRLKHWEWRGADAGLAASLDTVLGDRVLYARRVDVLKGKPVAMDDVFLAGRLANRLGEDDLAELDFLGRWQEVQKIALSHCRQVVEAVAADADVAKTVGLKVGAAVLKGTDVMYLDSGRPAGVFVSYYRADCFQFAGTVRIGGPDHEGKP